MSEELYDIYEITSYKTANNDFIENNVKQYTLDKLLQKLQLDKGCHIRVDPEKYYTFFGDIDGHKQKSNDFFEFMIKFLKDFYDVTGIEISDISYTRNESKEGSYHYSIPKLYCNCKKMKEIIGNMKIEYDKIYGKEQNKVIDTSIYSKHWFRMPNQTKEGVEGTEHFIVRGELVDFVVECIDDCAVNIGDKKYIGKIICLKENISENEIDFNKLKKSDFTENDIRNLVNMISLEKIDNYQNWIDIGICLKNLDNDYLTIWNDWSKKSDKYKDGECFKKWKTFNKQNGKQLKIGSLIKWAKEDNLKKFKSYWNEKNIKSIVKDNKNIFPDNDLKIKKIYQNKNFHSVALKDKYCPICEEEHETSNNMFIDITPIQYYMRCTDNMGYSFPEDFSLKKKELEKIFPRCMIKNLQVNIFGNTFNGNNELNVDFDIENIFEDKELNNLIFESLECSKPAEFAKIIFQRQIQLWRR